MGQNIYFEGRVVIGEKFRLRLPAKVGRREALEDSDKVFLICSQENHYLAIYPKDAPTDDAFETEIKVFTNKRKVKSYRLIIPQHIRERISLKEHQEVRLICRDGIIRLEALSGQVELFG